MNNLKCLVCGMRVNNKNFDLNECAFIDKNTKDYIKYCPFCGVNEIYLSDEEEVYSVDSNMIDETTKKILDSAMKLEIFNSEFYEEASKLAESEEITKMFHDLSKIEFMHAKVHQKLGGFRELPKLHKPDYTKYNKDKMLLEQANKREKHAVTFYKRYYDRVNSDNIRKVFNALSEVEKEHVFMTNDK